MVSLKSTKTHLKKHKNTIGIILNRELKLQSILKSIRALSDSRFLTYKQ